MGVQGACASTRKHGSAQRAAHVGLAVLCRAEPGGPRGVEGAPEAGGPERRATRPRAEPRAPRKAGACASSRARFSAIFPPATRPRNLPSPSAHGKQVSETSLRTDAKRRHLHPVSSGLQRRLFGASRGRAQRGLQREPVPSPPGGKEKSARGCGSCQAEHSAPRTPKPIHGQVLGPQQ